MYITLILIGISLSSIIILSITKQNEKDLSCYNWHLQECLDAHSQNLTYLLCSGFNVPPQSDDNEYFCRFNPNRSCYDIPKECLT